ncbi:hypothetical protein AVEN_108795-1 [Araneus ventricosus]|uniref:Uncharacterized protein n=1 Tax=Araneus ventricosus TaxID=182803 RepID=A0A4Y2CDC0_ARAVE|nr:hypothetical protein AVEN_108795-1 [Araneus ventricosus]
MGAAALMDEPPLPTYLHRSHISIYGLAVQKEQLDIQSDWIFPDPDWLDIQAFECTTPILKGFSHLTTGLGVEWIACECPALDLLP